MTKRKTTKRALLLSALSLLVCVSMLVGSTFAWFTDSVTSSGNKIQAGTLKVDLELLEKDGSWTSIKDSGKAIFDYQNWEPGYTDVKVLRITNEGSLALKWVAKFVSANELSKLADVIDVYVCPSETELAMPAGRDLTGYNKVGTVAEFVNTISETTNGTLEANTSAYLGIALKMQETAGNEYQGLDLGGVFDIQILATQYTSESDSFGNQYDNIAFVSNADALKAAIAEGKNVMLTNDIAVDADSTITVSDDADVILDLNGYEISGTSSTSGKNRALFTVKGEMSVIGNGTVSMVHTGANMEWNNLSAPFSVEAGILTLGKGVNVMNFGGTNMAYAVDVNTTLGETVLNVDGATLYSTYIGVRIFNNHSTAKGIVNYNAGIIYGAKDGYDIWAQLMSKPAENAVVNIADGINYTTADKSGTMYYIADDATLVSTPDALANALVAGGKVVLATDVDLAINSTITLGKGVVSTLDLNGHTLSGENTRTATHNFMIDVNGGTFSASNGTIAMKHTGTNIGWNGAATVIDVTNGGVLNLDGVTVKNEGGTDMNFAVHLNNWGEVTLNADNCVFDAPYCSVRVFNSGPQNNNVKITNSTLTGGTRAFWVHNYASADMGGKVHSGASAAYDKAAVDARLNLDIYNNNNTFEITGTAKSPIRYGFNEVVYYDTNGNIVN